MCLTTISRQWRQRLLESDSDDFEWQFFWNHCKEKCPPGDIAYWRIHEICDQTGILLMMDEVKDWNGTRSKQILGIRKLGHWARCFTSAKGLGSGIPIGALMSKKFACLPAREIRQYILKSILCNNAVMSVKELLVRENLQNVQGRDSSEKDLRAIAIKIFQLFCLEVRGWDFTQRHGLDTQLTFCWCRQAAIDEVYYLCSRTKGNPVCPAVSAQKRSRCNCKHLNRQ